MTTNDYCMKMNAPDNKDELFKIKKGTSVKSSYRNVGRDGIEPPTQGFSVLCSTDLYKDLATLDYFFD